MAPVDVNDFVSYANGHDGSSFADRLDRKRAIVAVQALLNRLQSPHERTFQLLHTDSYVVAAVKSLIYLDLFNIWERDGGQPKTITELGRMTGAEPNLLERLLRVVVAAEMLSIDGEGRYTFTRFAGALGSGQLFHAWMLHSYTIANSVIALPRYLQAMHYRSPTGSQDCPWAYHMGTPFIEFLKSNADAYTHLNAMMQLKNVEAVPWFSYYPVTDLLRDASRHSAALVDIGGGTGYDIKALHDHTQNLDLLDGQLVLQDLPQVLQEAGTLPPAIQKQPYDFFTDQPVMSARAYFMHNVLHDWSATDCHRILAYVKSAMKPGYSCLLINENIITSQSTAAACATDLSMMTVNGGSERTEAQWRDLLATAGFRVIRIHLSPAADEGVIEAEICM